MGDVLFAAIAATLVVVAVVAHQIFAWSSRRALRAEEPYGYLCDSHGFTRVADRFFQDTRIVRYAANLRDVETLVEVGMGPGVDYVRIEFPMHRPRPLGIRMSSDRQEDSLWMRLLRMKEYQLGLENFDTQFILRAQREDRLQRLVDHDVRRMLMNLNSSTRDVRVDDAGLQLFIDHRPPPQAFHDVLEDGAELAAHLARRAEDVIAEEARVPDPAASLTFPPEPGTLATVGSASEEAS